MLIVFDTTYYELPRINSTCHGLNRVDTTCYELNRVDTTKLQVGISLGVDEWSSRRNFGLRRQVAPPAFTDYRAPMKGKVGATYRPPVASCTSAFIDYPTSPKETK